MLYPRKKIRYILVLFIIAIIIFCIIYLLIKSSYRAEGTPELTIDINNSGTAISDELYGSGVVSADEGGGLLAYKDFYYDGTLKQWIQQPKRPLELNSYVVEKSKQAGLASIRFMNGNVYDWRAGIGPIETRPKRVPNISNLRSTDSLESWNAKKQEEMKSNNFGTDELVWFCKTIQAEPLMTVSTIFGKDDLRLIARAERTPSPYGDQESDVNKAIQSATNWVEYVNGEMKEEYKNKGWEPIVWTGADPDKEEAYIEGDTSHTTNPKSWKSWEKAPDGYFTWLRWKFAQDRKAAGENYLIDGSAYQVKNWEIGNEVQYFGNIYLTSYGEQPWANPRTFQEHLIGDSEKNKDGFIPAMKNVKNSRNLSTTDILIGSSSQTTNINNAYPISGYMWNSGSEKMQIDKIEVLNDGQVKVYTKTPHKFYRSNIEITITGLRDDKYNLNGNHTIKLRDSGCAWWQGCQDFTLNQNVINPPISTTIINGAEDTYVYFQGVYGAAVSVNSITDESGTGNKIVKILSADGVAAKGNQFGIGDTIDFEDSSGISTAKGLVKARSATQLTVQPISGQISDQKIISQRTEAYKELDFFSLHDYVAPGNQFRQLLKKSDLKYFCTDKGNGTFECDTTEKLTDGTYQKTSPCTYDSIAKIYSCTDKTVTLRTDEQYSCMNNGNGTYTCDLVDQIWDSTLKKVVYDKLTSCKQIVIDGNTRYSCLTGDQTEYDELFFGDLPSDKKPFDLSVALAANNLATFKTLFSKPIVMSEYNIEYGVQGGNSSADVDLLHQFRLKSGLAAAYLMNGYLKNGIKSANQYSLSVAAGWYDKMWRMIYQQQIVQNYQKQTLEKAGVSPTYLAISLYGKYAKGRVVPVNSSIALDKHLNVIATKNDNKISLFVLNLSSTNNTQLNINTKSFQSSQSISIHTLNSKDLGPSGMESYNDDDLITSGQTEPSSPTVAIKDMSSILTSQSMQYSFPAHSLTVIEYTLAPSVNIPTEKVTKGWNMLSLPGISDDNFSFLQTGSYNPINKLQWFNFVSNNYVKYDGGASMVPKAGYGYWLKIDDPGQLSTTQYHNANYSSVEVEVGKGWNLLGNPFEQKITFDNMSVKLNDGSILPLKDAVSQKLVAGYMYSWDRTIGTSGAYNFISNNTAYSNQPNYINYIPTYKAFWLLAKSDKITNVLFSL